MRANYVQAFYLPEHQPAPSAYVSHFGSRLSPHRKNSLRFFECGRSLNDISICAFCQESEDRLKCAEEMIVKGDVLEILKPFKCGKCELRFPDEPTLNPC